MRAVKIQVLTRPKSNSQSLFLEVEEAHKGSKGASHGLHSSWWSPYSAPSRANPPSAAKMRTGLRVSFDLNSDTPHPDRKQQVQSLASLLIAAIAWISFLSSVCAWAYNLHHFLRTDTLALVSASLY